MKVKAASHVNEYPKTVTSVTRPIAEGKHRNDKRDHPRHADMPRLWEECGEESCNPDRRQTAAPMEQASLKYSWFQVKASSPNLRHRKTR
jgi:hypothetical protein